MDLFSIQRCTAIETTLNAGTVSGTFHTVYQLNDSPLVFEDNPGVADLWNVPRRQEHIYTMNFGGVNVDMGADRSKQDMKLTVNVATQAFYDKIMGLYLYDPNDQMYVLKSHRAETWVVKWKDITPKYLATLPPQFAPNVPLPPSMVSGTPFKNYADVYELAIGFLVVDYNINV